MTSEATSEAMVDQRMNEEFGEWETALVRRAGSNVFRWPHPQAEGGLPSGWEVRYIHQFGNQEVAVVERAGGGWSGWTMVRHWVDAAGTPISMKWMHSSSTLAGLYATTESVAIRMSTSERAVRDYLLTLYDLTDPVEAAEVTLVGLGARITVYPKALTV